MAHAAMTLQQRGIGQAMEQDQHQFLEGNGSELAAPLREILGRHRASIHDPAVHALAREVISRLDRSKARAPDAGWRVDPAEVSLLCDALLSGDDLAADALVFQAVSRGMPPDVVHLRYIAEAAHLMGHRWTADQTTSASVVIGAGRIYTIMRKLRSLFVSARVYRPDTFRAVFASAPGETHTIGLTMAADYLRRRGWQIDIQAGLAHADLVDAIGHSPYPVIGLTASRKSMVFALARLIVALRISNPAAWIMIGGNIVAEEPDIVALIDADSRVVDMEDAVAQMEMVMQGGGALQQG